MKSITPFVQIFLFAFIFVCYNLSGAEIFVSTTGSDNTGNGSIGNPYATLDKACNYVAAGDTIFMRGGIYTGTQQKIDAHSNGTINDPIVIINYPGEEPIIDGTGLGLSATTSLLMIAKWEVEHMQYFVIEGLTVRNSSGRGIGFYRTTNLTIKNCKVYNTWERGIGGFGYYTTIEGNEVFNCGLQNENGIMGSGGWPVMIRLTFDYDNDNRSEHAIIRNNYVYECWGEGISPGEKSYDIVIENNTIRDVWSVGVYCDNPTNITIRNNYIYSTNPMFYRFGRPATGILLANENPVGENFPAVSNIAIYNNLITKCGKGVSFWFNSSNNTTGNTYTNITVAYNTIVETTYQSIAFDDVPAGYTQPSGCIMQNNIIENGSSSNFIDDPSAWTISHNCWVDGVPAFDLSSASFQGQPHFTSPSVTGGFEGFKLTAWSECLDTGTTVSGITTDYWGNARDASHPAIGMHEPSFSIYYVDAAVSSSGDGKSWATAKKTIGEAAVPSLNPGNIVYIKPGTYPEDVAIESNGAQIVGITANVNVSASNKISFPAGTDLSGVDLENYPEENYAYVYRSWKSNNGYFKITEVDDANDFVIVKGSDFIYETGISGDFNYLSAAIGRPVVYKKYSNFPESERVVLDCTDVTEAYTILYIGDYIDEYDAYPANYNIIDGLDVTASEGGIHLQSSNFNVLANGRSYTTTAGTGCLMNGNETRVANYNMLMNYQIYDVVGEGIYIGAGDHPQFNNHTHFNHILNNEIFMLLQSDKLENAIDVKEYNKGTLIAGNTIRDLTLMTQGNGILDIRNEADNTLVYNNDLKDIIGTGTSGTKYLLNLYQDTENVWIFNNLIYLNNAVADDVYAVNIRGDNTSGNYFVHNTIYNTNRGILVQNYGTGVDVTIANNIFNAVNNSLIEEWTSTVPQEGQFTFQNNLFNVNPNSSQYPVSSDFIGNPNFANASSGNFRLTAFSTKAINKAVPMDFPELDFELNQHDATADLGSYEYLQENTHNWTGILSAAWGNSGNWSQNTMPGSSSVVNIPNNCENYPQISAPAASPVVIENLTIENGGFVEVLPGGCLTIDGFVRNYNGEEGIGVKSDATGTGSFISDQPVTVTMQRYISEWYNAIHGWHFLSSPVGSQAIRPGFVADPPLLNQDFFKWDEPTATWINTKQYDGGNLIWNPNFENNFVAGRGYLVAYQSTQTKMFAQTLNVEDVALSNLSRSVGNYSGWHLLGNPFASAIKWNEGNWNLTNIAGTAKIWNETNASYTDIPANSIIPAMNGFMVQVTENTGSLTIPAAARTHDDQGWYKNSGFSKIKLLVKDLDQNTAQESTILFHPEATEGFDPDFDSRFLTGYAPQFFSMMGDNKLSLNALNQPDENLEIHFSFVKNASTNFELTLPENSSAYSVYLKDLKTASNHYFDENGDYQFTSEDGDLENRFILKFSNTGITNFVSNEISIQVFGNQVEIFDAKDALIEVFNITGQLMFNNRSDEESFKTTFKFRQGIYLLRVQKGQSVATQKIYIKP